MRKLIYILIAGIIIVMTPAIALAQGSDAPSCLSAVAGHDVGSLSTDTVNGAAEVSVISTVSLEAVTGARVIIEDGVRYQNNCIQDIEIGLSGEAVLGDWDGLSAQLWLSTTDAPESMPNADQNGEWDDTPLQASAGTISGTTGSVVIPKGSSVQVGFVLVAGADFDGPAQLQWTAQARVAA